MSDSTVARTARPSIDGDSVLADLYADTWFTAQHDVTRLTGGRYADTSSTNDRWHGTDEEIHAHLALHPAF